MSPMLAASWEAWGLRGKFDLFGLPHLCVLALVLVSLVAMTKIARNPKRTRLSRNLEIALALLLLWSFPAKVLTRYLGDVDMVVTYLPMHFCDWAAIAGFFALTTRKIIMVEITYFWGMAGTLQGLVTPNIEVGFPHPAWFAFFQLHAGVVLAGLYLVFGRGWRPTRGAVKRTYLLGVGYLALAGLVNLMSVSNNYAFLREKPKNGSMLDALGPWPVYILVMQAVALVVFILFDMPFWRGRKK